MGPLHPSSIVVRTGIESSARPWTTRSVRIPLKHLSQYLQAMHQRGLCIESVQFNDSTEGTVATKETPKASQARASAAVNVKTTDKPSKRSGRRRKR